MKKVTFASSYKKLNNLIKEIKKLDYDGIQPLLDKVSQIQENFKKESPIKIVFIGEFSSGKSSIISALTGEEVKIGADVTTDKISSYPWNGFELVDTPGVQADSQDTDHDRISKEAMIDADLIFFVISNELFNQQLADHFHYITQNTGLGLSKKTALIVNKLDRENNEDEIKEEVKKVSGDISCYFLSAKKYLDSLTEKDTELKERFATQSRFDEFIKSINDFIIDNQLIGKISTPFSQLINVFDTIRDSLTSNTNTKKELELIKQCYMASKDFKQEIREIENEKIQEIKTLFSKQQKQAITEFNHNYSSTSNINQEDVNSLVMKFIKEGQHEVETITDTLSNKIQTVCDSFSAILKQLENSPLGEEVKKIRSKRYETGVGAAYDSENMINSSYITNFFLKINKPLGKAIQHRLRDVKNPKEIHEFVYSFGKNWGKKFKPWEAVKISKKLSKGLRVAGRAITFLNIGLEAGLNIYDEKQKEKRNRQYHQIENQICAHFLEQRDNQIKGIKSYLEKIYENIDVDTARLVEQENQINNKDEKYKATLDAVRILKEKSQIILHTL